MICLNATTADDAATALNIVVFFVVFVLAVAHVARNMCIMTYYLNAGEMLAN